MIIKVENVHDFDVIKQRILVLCHHLCQKSCLYRLRHRGSILFDLNELVDTINGTIVSITDNDINTNFIENGVCSSLACFLGVSTTLMIKHRNLL